MQLRLRYVLQDWGANRSNPKAQLVLVCFRTAQLLRGPRERPAPILARPYLVVYRVAIEWILGIELPWNTTVGHGLRILHGQGLVVNNGAVIGSNCTMRQGVTIGDKTIGSGRWSDSPRLDDNVDVGAHAQIIGPIRLGANSVIGAGAVVVSDVPSGAAVAGNPARVLPSVRKPGRVD